MYLHDRSVDTEGRVAGTRRGGARPGYVAAVGEGVACDALRSAIAAAGWYTYFDQVDFAGEAGPAEAVLRHHIELAAA